MKKWAFVACVCILAGCNDETTSVEPEAIEQVSEEAIANTAEDALRQFDEAHSNDELTEKGELLMTAEQYGTEIAQHLQQYSEPLIETLRNVQRYNFDEAVELVDFQAFTDPTLFSLAITMFSMDKNASEVFGNGETFAGSEEVLSEVAYYSLLDEQQDAFYERYEEQRFDDVEQRVISEWFAKCWEEAGGETFTLPAYFTFHDANQSYDLQQGQFVDSEALWE